MDPEQIDQSANLSVEEKARLQMRQLNLDKDILLQLEKDVMECTKALDLVISTTKSNVAEITDLSVKNMEAMKVSSETTAETINLAVLSANQYITKCQELNQVFKGIEPLATQIKQIKATLEMFEKMVQQLELPPPRQ